MALQNQKSERFYKNKFKRLQSVAKLKARSAKGAKMKKTIRGLSLFCAAVMSVGLFGLTACKKNVQGEKGVLSIASFEGGYGNTWTQALANAYMKYNPDVKVNVECNALVRDDAKAATESGVSATDLFFIDGISIGRTMEDYGTLEDMSSLYNLSPKAGDKEEDVLIKDKIMPEILDDMKYSGDNANFAGKYYTCPTSSGPCSVILNTDALDNVFGAGNWKVPVTTSELISLADAIVKAQAKVKIAGVNYTVYPFIYAGNAVEYWRYMYYPWIAQYGGEQVWEQMQDLKINGEYKKEAYQPEAKAVAYREFEKIIKRSNGYCETSSMNNQHTESQKYFFQGRACMYVTGDWIERELESATIYKPNLKMIRTPIISALAEKIETDYSVTLGSTAQEKDEKLGEIVRAIDAGETSLDGVEQSVFDRVKTARSYTYTLGNTAIGFIMKNAVNKDIAIDFLRFMYSDEGLEIVLKESKSYIPTVNAKDLQTSNVSEFRKSVNEIQWQNIKYIFSTSKDPIRYRAGLDAYIGTETPEVAMGKKTGALTADGFLEKELRLLNANWSEYMKVV